ncbi:MAG: hypothetical protein CVV18_06475 [Gammaproteobacteria bacterium HGW-Gammaproteobacteria-8]|nr:MAG: hypothetical protein CVV18_06475 [Gammaproteobacteria bacterium HGW-Gammaproteobacteria-8]
MQTNLRGRHRTNILGIRVAAALVLQISLSACGVLGGAPEPEPEPRAPVGQPAAEPVFEPKASVADALQWIESGDFVRAQNLLQRLLLEQPGAPTVRLLLRQLRETPESLLPGPYREIELTPGESLSAVAERELGNPLYFVALARLNAIHEPRRIAAGTRLRVPQQAAAPAAVDTESEIRPGGDTVEQDLLTVADYLVASGQLEQALNLIQSTLEDRGGSEHLQTRFVQLGLERVDHWSSEGHLDDAEAWIREAAAVVTDPVLARRLEDSSRQVGMLRLLAEADAARDRGDLDQAFGAARQALELKPDEPRAQQLERLLRIDWTERLHEDALRSWRARDVDQSIRLWQRLLAEVPDFEPARIYLERALELRRRLE